MKVKYLVVGAGLTGLSFAKAMQNEDVYVIEKNNFCGGMAATYEEKTDIGIFKFDIGGHWFHNKDLGERLKEIADIEKIDMEWHERKAYVQLDSKNIKENKEAAFIDFPIQNNYMNCPEIDVDKIRKEIENLSEKNYLNYAKMLETSYGNTLYSMFFNPYNKKLFGRNLNEIKVHPFMKIRNVKTGDNGYNDKFMYPSNGKGIAALVNEIKTGIKVLYEHEILEVNSNEKYCIAEGKKIYYENLISTIPLKELCKRIDIDSCKNLGKELQHSKGNIWLLGVKKREIHDKINWVYNSSEQLSYYRWGTFTKVDSQMAPEGYSSIYIEANTDYGIKKGYKELLEDLKNNGIIEEENDVVCAKNILLDYNYCFYSKEVDEIQKILKENNIYSIGRYGAWHWSSMNQDIKQAIETADFIKLQK